LKEVEKERRAAIQMGPGKSDSSVESLAANEMKQDRQLKVTPAITFLNFLLAHCFLTEPSVNNLHPTRPTTENDRR
jgi:hypothetical protein